MTRVDVIIPVFNAAATVAHAIRSVQGQTFREHRILVVDDGSTDDTAMAVAPFVDGVNVLYLHQMHAGVAAARNEGLRSSSAPFIAFQDADDQWLPSMLESCLTLLEAGRYDLVSVDNYLVDLRQGVEIGRKVESYDFIECPPDELFLTILERGAIGGPHKAVFRREVFERVGHFDTSFPCYSDLDLWTRIARAGLRWGHVRTPLVLYHRWSANQVFWSNPRRALDARIRIVRHHAPEAIRRSAAFRRVLARMFWNFGRRYVYEFGSYSSALRCFLLSAYYRPDPRLAARSALGYLRAHRGA